MLPRSSTQLLTVSSLLFAVNTVSAGITEIRTGREPGRTRVVLDLEAPVIYEQLAVEGSGSLVFLLRDLRLEKPLPPADLGGTPIAGIRAEITDDDGIRLYFAMNRTDLRAEHFTLRPFAGKGHRLVVDLYEPENKAEVPPPQVASSSHQERPNTKLTSTGPDEVVASHQGVTAPSAAAAKSEEPAVENSIALPGASRNDSFGKALDMRSRGYTELSSAYTWPEESHLSKMRARVEYGFDGRINSRTSFRFVMRGESDLAYLIEDDFYPQPVQDDQLTEFRLREAYFDYSLADWEFRLGHQHVVWGEMVGLFLADVVSAKDTREFFLQDFEAIRLPQWAVRAERFGDKGHLELLWVPYPTFDEIGKPGSNFYPLPQLSGPVIEQKPEHDFSDQGYGLRYSQLINGWDLSGFYYRSTDVTPSLYLTDLGPEIRHDRIHQFGATFSKDLNGVVLKGEAVYTDGRSFVSNSPDAVLGVESSAALDYILGLTMPKGDWNFDFQLFASQRFDHTSGMLFDETELGATLLASYQFNERLEAQTLYLTGFNRTDQSIQSWLGWRFTPSWRLRAGIDWFDGDPIGFFGRYDAQDRFYIELKRWF